MANYYGHARTNYCTIRDLDGFNVWAKRVSAEVVEKGGKHGLIVTGTEDGVFCTDKALEDGEGEWTGEYEDIDLAEVAPFLADGECMIFMEVGAKKLRYLVATALLVHSDGRTQLLDLNQLALAAAPEGTTPVQW